MTSNELKNLTHQYVMNTYGRFPVAIDRGEGARLYDFEGNEYIDFTSGIGVTAMTLGPRLSEHRQRSWVTYLTSFTPSLPQSWQRRCANVPV